MNKIFRPYLTLALAGSLLAFTSCDDHGDEPHSHEEGELITTVTLTMTPQDGGTPITATYRDVDGRGGDDPVMTPANVVLQAGTVYNTNITLMDDSHDAEDLTAEIRAEGAEHELFFEPSPAGLVTVTKTDRDSNNRPIGLESTIETSQTAQAGTLHVVLKHQPGGLKTDNSTVNTGETDVDVTYSITLQ
ncbi:hypothetical protein [uncultured Pontibacter sp.]|uniref:hypothetical protein n=1 Tax=uncultured Pontibacter sp. TaxID=453356 RepID=UPI00260A56EC|nr:hypothetical protein [uncultured Pontibacter sp.]